MRLLDPELVSEFVAQSLEHLEDVEPLLLDMEKRGAASPDAMNEMFRAVHSIKGAAGFLGLEAVQQLSHAMESLFMGLRDGDLAFQAAMGDPLLAGVDQLRGMLRALRDDQEDEAETPGELIAVLGSLVVGGLRPADPDPELTAACRSQIERGHHLVVLPIPGRKTLRLDFLARAARFGDVVRAQAPRRTQAIVGSPLEPDLLAEALGLEADAVQPFELPALAVIEPTADEPSRGSRAFDVVAIELGFLGASDREPVLARQHETGRSFGATAVELGLLSHEQCALVRAEQLIRLADRAGDGGDAVHEALPTELPVEGADRRAETVRVNKTLLDKLMDLAGELVLGRNQLRQVLESVDERRARSLFQNIDRVTTQLQEHVIRTRMQQIRGLFDRLPRLVRDLGRRLDKQVDLELVGGDVELDRSIVEALTDPLMHLLRNSLDHGIEGAEGRRLLGKPPRGRIRVSAAHERGRVVIEVRDDGSGIDPERVRAAALERGVIDREQAAALGEREALELIFRPGLSTADEVTDLSGRGVGLDVVKTNIEEFGGQIELETAMGEGSRFVIHLPLTLAIVPSLIVSVAGERFAVPQVALVEVVGLSESEPLIETIRGAEVLRLRGSLIPLVRLRRCLGLPDHARADAGAEGSVVVLRSGPHEYGLAVDELHDGEEIVVKALPGYLSECGWYAGTTILGDGRVAMILDAAGIARGASVRFEELRALDWRREAKPRSRARSVRSLVLFASGADEQFAMPLSDLHRLERVSRDQVERIGSRSFVQHRGRSLALVYLEDVLPVQGGPSDEDRFFVLIPRMAGRDAAIVASRIVDTIETDIEPDPGRFGEPGLLGSAIVEGRLTLFLDTERLLDRAGVGVNA
jgi:two-component system chemotaxis sensor kinase CheA